MQAFNKSSVMEESRGPFKKLINQVPGHPFEAEKS